MKNTGDYNKVDHAPVIIKEVISSLNINPDVIYKCLLYTTQITIYLNTYSNQTKYYWPFYNLNIM